MVPSATIRTRGRSLTRRVLFRLSYEGKNLLRRAPYVRGERYCVNLYARAPYSELDGTGRASRIRTGDTTTLQAAALVHSAIARKIIKSVARILRATVNTGRR